MDFLTARQSTGIIMLEMIITIPNNATYGVEKYGSGFTVTALLGRSTEFIFHIGTQRHS